MPFGFRIRFELPVYPRKYFLGIDSPKWTIENKDHNIVLRSALQDIPIIRDSYSLVLRGENYETEEAAQAAGVYYQNMLIRIGAFLLIGFDLGSRNSEKFLCTNAGLNYFQKQSGNNSLNDIHGLMTFKTDLPNAFIRIKGDKKISMSQDNFERALTSLVQNNPEITERERIAYDFFSASFFQSSLDARFLLLVTALETLIEQGEKSSNVIEHINKLISDTESCQDTLSNDERVSLIKSLEQAKIGSISHAGRELVKRLSGRKYNNQSPRDFFDKCYKLRCDLVHGNLPGPALDNINKMTSGLERLISDLLCGPLLSLR